ncbi:MAG: hypothetical protein JW751_19055 [Polyangiaceae bacterium]|nr:hypothetical protein [Polyangiaceae bacterium]
MTQQTGLDTIRTAYRYVTAYQRRVLDIVGLLDDSLGEIGFGYQQWATESSGAVEKRLPLDGWSWDFLPLMDFRVRWSKDSPEENKAGAAWLWLRHVADTGLEAFRGNRNIEPDGLGEIPEGSSVVRLYWAASRRRSRPPCGTDNPRP